MILKHLYMSNHYEVLSSYCGKQVMVNLKLSEAWLEQNQCHLSFE